MSNSFVIKLCFLALFYQKDETDTIFVYVDYLDCCTGNLNHYRNDFLGMFYGSNGEMFLLLLPIVFKSSK